MNFFLKKFSSLSLRSITDNKKETEEEEEEEEARVMRDIHKNQYF